MPPIYNWRTQAKQEEQQKTAELHTIMLTYPADFAYNSHGGGLVKNANKKGVRQSHASRELRASHWMGKVFDVQHAQSMNSSGYPVVQFSKGWRADLGGTEKTKTTGGWVEKGDENTILESENTEIIKRKESFWRMYCTNSTIHGLKYLADRTVHWFER